MISRTILHPRPTPTLPKVKAEIEKEETRVVSFSLFFIRTFSIDSILERLLALRAFLSTKISAGQF